MEELYDLVEHVIDKAFMQGEMKFNFYEYLKDVQAKKYEVDDFMKSSTVRELKELISELDQYIEGGTDPNHVQLGEGYGHIPKLQAVDIRNYLFNIIEDAQRYETDRKDGRRRTANK